MLSIDPQSLGIKDRHHHLLNGIGPRPIAWVSTVDEEGQVNLAPFSFFNLFSSNPPILVFSPARRGRDNTTKHTLENIKLIPECTVNIVNHALLNQMVLTSLEYPSGVSELKMAGLSSIASDEIRVPRVSESPMQLECKVIEIKELGTEGAAGNMIIAEVVRIHIREEYLGENGFIDQEKIDLIGRLGEAYYVRANGPSLFEVKADVSKQGVGFPSIPNDVLTSNIITGNDLAQLAMQEAMPDETSVNDYKLMELSQLFLDNEDDSESLKKELHLRAKVHLESHRVTEAWKTLLSFNG
jgi:flavin reductase (DIM6/NTAB) family NADH-FMN oxidoreductase RutF